MSPPKSQTRDPLKPFRFNLEFRPRFSDLDPLGRVSNSRFFTYFEEARMAYLASLGLFAPSVPGPRLLVVQDTCRYAMPVQHHHLVQVHLRTADWTTRSFKFHYLLWLPEEDIVAAHGTTRVTCVNPGTRRTCGLPSEYMEIMRAYEKGRD
ncbi:MAG: acyl-CoA thioesterase [Desulfarculaceae bacterium]|nr:acyl-CoA thioesterase [Desulfarculaceae bacterium]MCF8071782.1 acyl-CoA thioesterase [Desulfarculaceae bacterium]MCF8101332.1 acyl-CoA thioesterase [Desulfarculaceae bacterium]MCF8117291.1 acyl-CoA thioesterase [Desulfarculaceae bacterium]